IIYYPCCCYVTHNHTRMPPIKYYSTLGYYAVRVRRNPGIYLSWNECKEQVYKYPSAMYKKFDTKQHASEYIHSSNINTKEKIEINSDIIDRINYLIKEREGKTYFNHIKGYSEIYENEQADRLAYLGSQKEYIKDFNFPLTDKGKIDFYFNKQDKTDDSENA